MELGGAEWSGGGAEMVRGEWVQEGAVVIDCGINYIPGLRALSLCVLTVT